ncbi:PilZ domain-containing protein [Methylobacterium phyllosphaerae]
MENQRISRRVAINLQGRIAVAGHPAIPCVVHDMSRWGVRLRLVGTERVPSDFTLTIDATDKVIGCETVWKNADEIGALTDLME